MKVLKGIVSFLLWTILGVIMVPIVIVGALIYKAIPYIKAILPSAFFVLGIVYPLLHTIVKWNDLINRDIWALSIALLPIMYWKVLDSAKKTEIPAMLVIVPYAVFATIVFAVYL